MTTVHRTGEPRLLDQAHAREVFCEAISGYSESRWSASWLIGIEGIVRREGGPWLLLAYAAGGWPQGVDGEDGTEPLTDAERATVAKYLAGLLAGTSPITTEWAVLCGWPGRTPEWVPRSNEVAARGMADVWNRRTDGPDCTVMRRDTVNLVGEWTPDGGTVLPTRAVDMMLLVRQARELAYRAHEGQTDKAGEPYVDAHVADVAARVHRLGPLAEAVAWLHDVVEDTEITLDDLRRQFPVQVVDAVDALTRREGEHPDDYYRRVKANATAALVKVHGDIPSNTDPERLELLPPEVRDRLSRKYQHALQAILR